MGMEGLVRPMEGELSIYNTVYRHYISVAWAQVLPHHGSSRQLTVGTATEELSHEEISLLQGMLQYILFHSISSPSSPLSTLTQTTDRQSRPTQPVRAGGKHTLCVLYRNPIPTSSIPFLSSLSPSSQHHPTIPYNPPYIPVPPLPIHSSITIHLNSPFFEHKTIKTKKKRGARPRRCKTMIIARRVAFVRRLLRVKRGVSKKERVQSLEPPK